MLEHNPAGLRGKLLLIDEDTGEVLGEMETGALELEDDTHGAPGAGGKEQGPVVLDLENLQEGKVIGGIKVTEVPKDEMDDWMLKGASNLSCVPLHVQPLVLREVRPRFDLTLTCAHLLARPRPAAARTS